MNSKLKNLIGGATLFMAGVGAGMKLQENKEAELNKNLEIHQKAIDDLSEQIARQTAKVLEGEECLEREDYYFENLKRGDKVGAASARSGRSRRTIYSECGREQAQDIYEAKLFVESKKQEILDMFEVHCKINSIYCPDRETAKKVLDEGAWSYGYCEKAYFTPKNGSIELGTLREVANEERAGSFDIRPTAFEHDFCTVTETVVHEWAHVVTGQLHSNDKYFMNDWIYKLGFAAKDLCEHPNMTIPTL